MNKDFEFNFRAKVRIHSTNPYIDIPQNIWETFEQKGYVGIVGKINGFNIRGNLVPNKYGNHRFFLNKQIQINAKTAIGDLIDFSFDIDKGKKKG